MSDQDPLSPRQGPQPFEPLDGDGDEFGYDLYDTYEGENDRGLIRVVGVIAVLGIILAILLLPPISLLNRGGDEGDSTPGISTRARDDLPPLPGGLEARSALYDITSNGEFTGSAALTVRLGERADDGEHLAFYTYEDGDWTRLASIALTDDGNAAHGEVDLVPANIAVLARTSFARSLALIVGPGMAPAVEALTAARIVSVRAATPSEGGDLGGVDVPDGALTVARGATSRADVYLGVYLAEPSDAAAVDAILTIPDIAENHADALLEAAESANADGLHIEYLTLDAARRQAFSDFVATLAERGAERGLGIVVAVPTPSGADFGAYDWEALTAAAEVWLAPPTNRSLFYDHVGAALATQRAAGTDLGRVSLMLDRNSRERSAEGVRSLTLHEALAFASAVESRAGEAVGPGEAVSVAAVNLDRDAGNSGLYWDNEARAVTFAYEARGGPRTVWLENRYSAAFRLDLASRYGLGGVAVSAAHGDPGLPDLWDVVLNYVEDDAVHLLLPYGPYLRPQWAASDGQIEGSGGLVVWRAPQRTGTYDVTLIVSDGVVFVGQQIAQRVADAEPTASAPADPAPTPTPDANSRGDTRTNSGANSRGDARTNASAHTGGDSGADARTHPRADARTHPRANTRAHPGADTRAHSGTNARADPGAHTRSDTTARAHPAAGGTARAGREPAGVAHATSGDRRFGARHRAAHASRQRDAPDVGAAAGVAVRHARGRRHAPRQRRGPLRGERRAGHRGALTRRGALRLRRFEPPGVPRGAREPRPRPLRRPRRGGDGARGPLAPRGRRAVQPGTRRSSIR